MVDISPQRDLMTSAIKTIKEITDVPVFVQGREATDKFPIIILSTGGTNPSNRSKNETRSTYTIYVDYFDTVDHQRDGDMMDNCYRIREHLQHLQLSIHNCRSFNFTQSEMIDNSTSKPLHHVTLVLDYYITEKSFI